MQQLPGVPQGCILSPLLFIFYTNDCLSHSSNCSLIKYADDVAIVGLLNNNEADYRAEINCFYKWCKDNALIWNTKKKILGVSRSNTW